MNTQDKPRVRALIMCGVLIGGEVTNLPKGCRITIYIKYGYLQVKSKCVGQQIKTSRVIEPDLVNYIKQLQVDITKQAYGYYSYIRQDR